MNIMTNKSSKEFIVMATTEDGDIFAAWKIDGGAIQSFEYIWGDYPPGGIATYPDIDAFVNGTTWHAWIQDGIKDTVLLEKIRAAGWDTIDMEEDDEG
jgi:hypothetical protein